MIRVQNGEWDNAISTHAAIALFFAYAERHLVPTYDLTCHSSGPEVLLIFEAKGSEEKIHFSPLRHGGEAQSLLYSLHRAYVACTGANISPSPTALMCHVLGEMGMDVQTDDMQALARQGHHALAETLCRAPFSRD